MLVHYNFERIVEQYAGNTAVSLGAASLTYHEVSTLAKQYETAIRQLSVNDTSPVVVSLKHDIRLYALFLGVMRCGRAYFYIDPDEAAQVKQALIKEIGAQLVIDDLAIIAANNIDLMHHTSIDMTAPCCLVQTSGTTMNARAIAVSHAAVQQNINHFHQTLQINSQDRISLLASPQFCAANSAIYGAFLSGACLLPFSVKANGITALIDWLAHEAVTVLHLTPSLFRLLAKFTRKNELPYIRAVKLGGEPVYPADVALFKNKFSSDCILVNGLGMSEAGGNIAHFVIRHDTHIAPELDMVPVGKVLSGHDVSIVDADQKPVNAGETGEIVIGGKFNTNDLGYFLADGSLVHIGRKNRIVKRHGFRVDLNAIESALLTLEQINNAAVYFSDEQLIACIELRTDVTENSDSIRLGLAELLPDYMLPQYFFFLPRLPLTQSGKIDRRALLSNVNKWQAQFPGVKPRNQLEARILALWQDILKCNALGVYDNFFAVGGDSLRAMEFIARLERELQHHYSLSLLAEHPTIAQIAENIHGVTEKTNAQTNMPMSVTMLMLDRKSDQHVRPLICIPGGAMSEKEILLFAGLLPFLQTKTSVIALRSNLPLDNVSVPTDIEIIAAGIVAEIKRNVTVVPPILVGECLACVLTLEVARQLAREYQEAPQVVLLNPWHPRLPGQAVREVKPTPVGKFHQTLKSCEVNSYTGQVDIVLAQDQPRTSAFCCEWWSAKLQATCAVHVVPGSGESYIRAERRFLVQKLNQIILSRA